MTEPTILVTTPPTDPFGPDATRHKLFASAVRPMVPIRHAWVQKEWPTELPRGSTYDRSSTLAKLVRDSQERAFDLNLLALAMYPVLTGTPMAAGAWARLLSPISGRLVSPAGISKTWATLHKQKLISRDVRIDRFANVLPLHESGSGAIYQKPGLDPKGTSKGYFYVPISYWLEDWPNRLTLPGKAMFMIWLSATSTKKTPTFDMSFEKAPQWYGVSERTAERGITELLDQGLMAETREKMHAPRSNVGYTYIHHRWLTGEFSYSEREKTRKSMVRKTRSAKAKPAGSTARGAK